MYTLVGVLRDPCQTIVSQPAVLSTNDYASRYPNTYLPVRLPYALNRLHLHLDILKNSGLHIVKDRVVLNHSKVLSLTEELFVRINPRAKHLLALLRTHLAHLLRHLVRG